jgi:hypothetical protein
MKRWISQVYLNIGKTQKALSHIYKNIEILRIYLGEQN